MDVLPVSGALGAEIRGVDVRSLDRGQIAEVRDQLHDYEVIFFRGARLGPEEHVAVAESFGEVAVFPLSRLRGATEPTLQVISDGPESPPEADYWHTDVTWAAEPPKYALLHAEVVPERGGDTLWASMTAAYEALSPTMQRLLAGLDVVHDCESFIEGMRRKGATFDTELLAGRLREAFPPVRHPLVRTHPETGRHALFLGGRFMRRIDGMSEEESGALLGLLARHIDDPRFHCRWRWQPGDLAVWDERSTNHRSAADHFPQVRVVRRVEITGDRPFFKTVA
ncbi:taurine dioxygenase [Parafrankia colletiae]|uniref:Taurine dioxygenase n=1 Tax=Parafrankia colletiae TaxID=573497 RepID=A0A1S1QBW4_9ACTN|nr:TauD/TfdA family dioxygenase [Parafrankia colletiae]MCK9902574.1 TauD/TfdA family dioxygenase [Frankia sp. Cpl3]OHV31450.1 taurine dioxygenase [Parafrankia colletiae]